MFSFADGSRRELAISDGRKWNWRDSADAVYVVFGPDSRKILIGALALETFALAADAKYRRLIPAELTI